jgi:diguanylate cyclase (GGDEF)-like protein
VRERLIHDQTVIRVVCVLAVLLSISRVVGRTDTGAWDTFVVVTLAVAIGGSLILAAIAWSSLFDRAYLKWASIIIPARNSMIAASIALAAAAGQLDALTLLPLILIGPFFFLGLGSRIAMLSGAAATLSFVLGAAIFDLALPIALRSSALLVMGFIACAIAARHLDQRSRLSFLKTRLVAELAEHDALTGAKNRRMLDEHLLRLWRQASQDDCTIAVLLIDVDHFKAYNDRYGHQAGDRALRRVAQHLQHFVRRPLDILARYGGEEFAVILYDSDAAHAMEAAEQIRRAVQELDIEHDGSRTSATVTVSIGLAIVQPTLGRNPHGALQLADQALYEAKLTGRNKVEVMSEEDYRVLETGSFARACAR